MSQAISLVIITLNEEKRLADCLDSALFVDEVVVVDSGSTDNTCILAEARGCRVIQQDWLGYGKQKDFAVQQAAHDWVLCLDADELLSAELMLEIGQLIKGTPELMAYEMPRRNRFMGRWLRYGEGYPDYSLRLFNRKFAQWSDDPVHEAVNTEHKVGRLKGDLKHRSEESLRQYLEKQNRYTSLQAEQMFALGKTTGAAKVVFSPLFRFLKMYLVRLGFMDGVPGLVHILIGCNNTAVKYMKLMELMRRVK